jgi:hypothetical protein
MAFGKGITFHAYSILTGKFVILLSKLGGNQAEEINKYHPAGSNANNLVILVSQKTKEKHASLLLTRFGRVNTPIS